MLPEANRLLKKAVCYAIQGWMARKSSLNMLDLAQVGFAHDS
jgi:hypothetical protein